MTPTGREHLIRSHDARDYRVALLIGEGRVIVATQEGHEVGSLSDSAAELLLKAVKALTP